MTKFQFGILIALSTLGGCNSINNAINKEVALNKKSLISFKLDFETANKAFIKDIESQKFPKLSQDLAQILPDYIENTCFENPNFKQIDDLAIKCRDKNKFTIADMFKDAINISFYDLNKDGKKDLVLAMGGKTGLSGLGACGISEYRIYENVNSDFRPIGKASTVNAQSLYVYDDAGKNKFSSLVWKSEFNCDGSPQKSEQIDKYDILKAQYYEIK